MTLELKKIVGPEYTNTMNGNQYEAIAITIETTHSASAAEEIVFSELGISVPNTYIREYGDSEKVALHNLHKQLYHLRELGVLEDPLNFIAYSPTRASSLPQ